MSIYFILDITQYLCNSQGSEVGALEIHLDSNQYYIQKCKDGGRHERGSYRGQSGKNGIWKITKTSGSSPRIAGFLEDELKFDVQLSGSVCTNYYWRTFWSRDVAKIKFSSSDEASVQYRKFMGNQFKIL